MRFWTGVKQYSMVIFGYGFNDEHFNTVLYGKFDDVPTLIISKTIKKDIIEKALNNQKITLIYEDSGVNYLVHKKFKYQLKERMWDINNFLKFFWSSFGIINKEGDKLAGNKLSENKGDIIGAVFNVDTSKVLVKVGSETLLNNLRYGSSIMKKFILFLLNHQKGHLLIRGR